MNTTSSLSADVDAFLELTGMSASYFSKLAAGNGELVNRLRSGGRVWPETEVKVRAFIDRYFDSLPSASFPDGPQPSSSPAACPAGTRDDGPSAGTLSHEHDEVSA